MASAAVTSQTRQKPRYAHDADSKTSLAYSPDGKYLFTVGGNKFARRFEVGSTEEPGMIDNIQPDNYDIVVGKDFVAICADEGTVSSYGVENLQLNGYLTRCSLPAREIALSPDEMWLAVASDELTVKIVNIQDKQSVATLRGLPKPAKHVSFHPTGSYLAVSCSDGVIYIYSLTKEEPEIIKKLDGFIQALETTSETCSKVAWHPDGRVLAMPTGTRDIVMISRDNWERQLSFSGGHLHNITDIAWSPNGALLASSGQDGKVIIWETKTQKAIATYDYQHVCNLAWHPKKNILSFTTTSGQLYQLPDAVPESHASLLRERVRPAPLSQGNGDIVRDSVAPPARRRRSPTRDSYDSLLDGPEGVLDDNFIDDDDGAGYAEPQLNGFGKRGIEHLGLYDRPGVKRHAPGLWQPMIHDPFQPSSTPWKGNRRYLCVNLVGIIWTVNQDTHHTVTVEFYDREQYRDFHFTDQNRYDKACLNEHGTLFANSPSAGEPAVIFYRPHETWVNRGDWKTMLPEGEEVASIALSSSYIVVCTSNGYVRIYTLFGTPFRVFRQKHLPVVTCVSWRDYIFVVGNGAVGSDGVSQLTYTIENVKRDETLQSNDVIPIPEGKKLKTVFFSDMGDPCIYDTSGVLLVLMHWRLPGQAKWVPLLDTKLLERQTSGRVEESYWPVAVAQDKFHCIILKGREEHPYFPRPLLSEFDFKVPIHGPAPPSEDNTQTVQLNQDNLQEEYVRSSVLVSLREDHAASTTTTAEDRMELGKLENAVDKALIQLLALACKDDDGGERALEICGLFRQKRSWDLALKVAVKYERILLAEKISEKKDAMELDE